jgi:hypothetical protein
MSKFSEPSPRSPRLRGRLLLLLAVLVPLNAYWLMQSEVIRYAGHPTTTSLFYNCVFWLFLLVGANLALLRWAPRMAFARGELLAAYVVLQLTSALGSHDVIEVLLPILAKPFYGANAANNWADILLPRLPSWLVVSDKDALNAFNNGHDTLYAPNNLRAWALPVVCWTGFLGTMAGVMLCFNVLLRRQWGERERLPFPLIYLPMAMTEVDADRKTPLFRNRLLWIGFTMAVGYQVWNGLAFWYPSLPGIQIKYVDYGTVFKDRPWSSIGWLPLSFYPFAIALGILLPTDFLFSSWFFYWFWKGQLVVSAALAWDRTPNFPYVNSQALGGYLAVALSAIWAARRHLAAVIRTATGEATGAEADDEGSGLSYRAALIGIVAGTALLFTFCLLAGMRLWVVAAFFVIYFAIAIAVTRMRAELGPPVHDLHRSGPEAILPTVLGPTNVPRQDLVMFGLFYGFNRAYRAHPMPIQLEGLRMADQTSGLSAKSLTKLLFAFGYLGPLAAFWALLHLCYQVGASGGQVGPPNVLTIFGNEAWSRYTSQVTVPQPPQANEGLAVLTGMSFCLLLQLARIRLVGFPFHPVGYAVASSWGMSVLWMPMLIAWLAKILILRYGGLGMYRKCLPLVYGVILGECVAGSLWSLLGITTGLPTYAFWP